MNNLKSIHRLYRHQKLENVFVPISDNQTQEKIDVSSNRPVHGVLIGVRPIIRRSFRYSCRISQYLTVDVWFNVAIYPCPAPAKKPKQQTNKTKQKHERTPAIFISTNFYLYSRKMHSYMGKWLH
jgi:hypothetical protein